MMPEIDEKAMVSVFDTVLQDTARRCAVYSKLSSNAAGSAPLRYGLRLYRVSQLLFGG
jgi:hypothetical protein